MFCFNLLLSCQNFVLYTFLFLLRQTQRIILRYSTCDTCGKTVLSLCHDKERTGITRIYSGISESSKESKDSRITSTIIQSCGALGYAGQIILRLHITKHNNTFLLSIYFAFLFTWVCSRHLICIWWILCPTLHLMVLRSLHVLIHPEMCVILQNHFMRMRYFRRKFGNDNCGCCLHRVRPDKR